ncbi:MAG: hypothetical protein JWM80_3741 [Cyanobacteria bacterium RYN_339]|nr:hypothetical protein [Cyanobacteria bacterium RYN_339]
MTKSAALALVLAFGLSGCGVARTASPLAVKPAALTVKAKGPADVVRAIKVSAIAMIGYADKDHDAKLSPAEALSVGYNDKMFAPLDANKDGFLTEAEITSDTAINTVWMPLMGFMGQMFGGLDANKDGAITRKELDTPNFKVTATPWQTAPEADIVDKGFAFSDRNADGGLDQEERVTFLAYFVEHGYKLNISIHG